MNCKNCSTELTDHSKYCQECGAKVINERISIKRLVFDLLNVFGWDNRFFVTLRSLIKCPEDVFQKYLAGTRKRFTNPFTFFAIGAAFSLLVINQFSEEYLNLTSKIGSEQAAIFDNPSLETEKNSQQDAAIELETEQSELNDKMQQMMFKNYNLFSFLLLPLYAFFAFLVFGKPYNYGEHLVINAYIQGTTFLIVTILFAISLFTLPWLYEASFILVMFYYSYAYGKLYKHSFGRATLKFLKFIGILIITSILIYGIGFLIGKIF